LKTLNQTAQLISHVVAHFLIVFIVVHFHVRRLCHEPKELLAILINQLN